MTKGPEAKFAQKLQAKLKEQGWYVVKQHGTGASKLGAPDLICCTQGFFVALELKSKDGKPSDLQIAQGELIKKAGGVWLLVYDVGNITQTVKWINEEVATQIAVNLMAEEVNDGR